MSTEIKNGKRSSKNMSIFKMIKIFLVLLILSTSLMAGNSEKKWVIVIDAGHGGRDPGALGSVSREKDITLAIALKTGEYIEKNIENVTVIYTRKDDSTVELRERPKIANRNNADLFISIHANWAKYKSVMGAETYVMGHAKDQANLEVAMKENEVILLEDDHSTKYEGFDPKSPESYIMFTLMQEVFQEQSTDLASRVQTQFRERVSRNDRDVKQAGFWVLFTTTMPSVLIETGFITNPAEEKFLISKQGQDYLASAIYRACKDYISNIDSKSTISWSYDKTNTTEMADKGATVDNSNEITFRVQVATSSSRSVINPENFNGLKDVSELIVQDRYKYASGSFKEYTDAVAYRKKLETIYPDAFVIAVKGNKILPLRQALEEQNKK